VILFPVEILVSHLRDSVYLFYDFLRKIKILDSRELGQACCANNMLPDNNVHISGQAIIRTKFFYQVGWQTNPKLLATGRLVCGRKTPDFKSVLARDQLLVANMELNRVDHPQNFRRRGPLLFGRPPVASRLRFQQRYWIRCEAQTLDTI